MHRWHNDNMRPALKQVERNRNQQSKNSFNTFLLYRCRTQSLFRKAKGSLITLLIAESHLLVDEPRNDSGEDN